MSQPDTEGAARAVRRRLEIDGDRCLLVFDNAADPELVQRHLLFCWAHEKGSLAPCFAFTSGRPDSYRTSAHLSEYC